MPSRHALSAAVLAAVWLYFYPAAGCVMVGIALLICCLRVLTGVHPVSYTHLDVYKRQGRSCRRAPGHRHSMSASSGHRRKQLPEKRRCV